MTVTGLTTATVSFTAPTNGGSAITSYTATSDPGGITGTVTQAGSGKITVNGLTTGTTYKFKVTATNAVGTSTASQWSASVLQAMAPSAPVITALTSTGPTTMTVSVTAPANGGSAITSYKATSLPGGIAGTLTQAGSGNITVTGLTTGTAYTFRVTATNAVGTSAWSAWSTSVKAGTGNCKAPAAANVNWSYCGKSGLSLDKSNLAGANLTGTDFTYSSLTFSSLAGANLTGALLDMADIGATDLTKANLTGARLNNGQMSNTNFTDANLSGASLQSGFLNGTNFTRANLSGVNLTNSNMLGATLTGATLTGVTWTGVRCPNGKLGPYPCAS